jgi:nicotinamidase-related amidase
MATISRLKKTLDKGDTGLILFDALHGYLHPDDPGKRTFLEQRNILKNHTDMDLKPMGERGKPIVPHIRKNSKDSEIAAELAPAPGDVMVPKNRWSSFFETNLALQLRVRGIDTIVIAGGSTDVGIAVVVRDACYSMRGNNNEFFMERVFPRMGRVMTVDDAVKLMVPS